MYENQTLLKKRKCYLVTYGLTLVQSIQLNFWSNLSELNAFAWMYVTVSLFLEMVPRFIHNYLVPCCTTMVITWIVLI